MIPELMINKNNKRNHFNELLEVAYNKLKKIFQIQIMKNKIISIMKFFIFIVKIR